MYVSPWITSDLPQMDISKGLSHAELVSFLNMHPDIVGVTSLTFSLSEQSGDLSDPVAPDSDAILVSADQHSITLVAVNHD